MGIKVDPPVYEEDLKICCNDETNLYWYDSGFSKSMWCKVCNKEIKMLSDWYEEFKAKEKSNIIQTGEYFNKAGLICPYCGKEQFDYWSSLGNPDGEDQEYQCDSCERHFMFCMKIVFSGRTLK